MPFKLKRKVTLSAIHDDPRKPGEETWMGAVVGPGRSWSPTSPPVFNSIGIFVLFHTANLLSLFCQNALSPNCTKIENQCFKVQSRSLVYFQDPADAALELIGKFSWDVLPHSDYFAGNKIDCDYVR